MKSDNPLSKFKEQKDICENIKSFFIDVLVERGNGLVVFIDELDRCKPSYAVHLLEQIKHYLCDERITFVFSVNLEELQHTIKSYYGNSFDACRYLDRFFDMRIALPPVDKSKFYDKIGLNSRYVLEKVCQRVIETYNFELREITRYYRQVKTAEYEPTHESNKWDFNFSDGKARQLILMYIVPVIIGLRIVDLSMYDEFVNGKNVQPLIDIYNLSEVGDWVVEKLLNKDETFSTSQNKIVATKQQKLEQIYNAIFVMEYSANVYQVHIGEYTFSAGLKDFALRTASMLSDFADFYI